MLVAICMVSVSVSMSSIFDSWRSHWCGLIELFRAFTSCVIRLGLNFLSLNHTGSVERPEAEKKQEKHTEDIVSKHTVSKR